MTWVVKFFRVIIICKLDRLSKNIITTSVKRIWRKTAKSVRYMSFVRLNTTVLNTYDMIKPFKKLIVSRQRIFRCSLQCQIDMNLISSLYVCMVNIKYMNIRAYGSNALR